MIYDVPVPKEYDGPHNKRAKEIIQPLMRWIALNPPDKDSAAPFLGSLVCSFALPLVAYLGKDEALRVADHLKDCINDHRVHGKN